MCHYFNFMYVTPINPPVTTVTCLTSVTQVIQRFHPYNLKSLHELFMVLQIKKVVFTEVFNLLIEMSLCFSEILHVSVLCDFFLD